MQIKHFPLKLWIPALVRVYFLIQWIHFGSALYDADLNSRAVWLLNWPYHSQWHLICRWQRICDLWDSWVTELFYMISDSLSIFKKTLQAQKPTITWPRRCWPCAPWPSCEARRCWTSAARTPAWSRRCGGRWQPAWGESLHWRSCWGRRGRTGSADWENPCSHGRRRRRPSGGSVSRKWRRAGSLGAARRRRPRSRRRPGSATGCWRSVG